MLFMCDLHEDTVKVLYESGPILYEDGPAQRMVLKAISKKKWVSGFLAVRD